MQIMLTMPSISFTCCLASIWDLVVVKKPLLLLLFSLRLKLTR